MPKTLLKDDELNKIAGGETEPVYICYESKTSECDFCPYNNGGVHCSHGFF